MILQEHLGRIEELWLSAVEKDGALSRVTLNKEQQWKLAQYFMNSSRLGSRIVSVP